MSQAQRKEEKGAGKTLVFPDQFLDRAKRGRSMDLKIRHSRGCPIVESTLELGLHRGFLAPRRWSLLQTDGLELQQSVRS
jgi:hypothetical protein